MSRLPIRVRLTLAFAVAMAVVLAATGALVYLGLRSALDEAINDTLESRVEDLVAGESPEANSDESWAQVIDGSGRVGRAHRGNSPCWTRRSSRVSSRAGSSGSSASACPESTDVGACWRLPSTVSRGGASSLQRHPSTTVTARSATSSVSSSSSGRAALLLASLLGYGLATAALRPVEAMREEAATISGAETGRRLSIGRANDELARLGTTLNDMLERLDGALEHERSFIADASHELRTPLALLKAELELSLRRPRSAEELEKALRSAATETDRLTQLAEHLLVLARSDQGRLTLRREPIVAESLAAEVAGRFARKRTANRSRRPRWARPLG